MGHGKILELTALLERHGDQVDADLRRYYGTSLRQLFTGELAVDECWALVGCLPRDSATTSAIYADPERAVDDGPAAEPTLAEFSPEVEAIADLRDVCAAILAHLSALTSKQPVRLDAARRPGDARREQARQRREAFARAKWDAVLNVLIPEGGQQHG